MNRRDMWWIAGIWLLMAGVAIVYGLEAGDPLVGFVVAAVDGALATGLYVFVRRWARGRNPRDVRWIAAIWVLTAGVAVVLALVTGEPTWSGFVVAWIGFALTGAYWRHRWRKRPCPDCGARMPSYEPVCPRCGSTSEAWLRHRDVWWVRGPDGTWQWLDEGAGTFRSYADEEAPSAPPFS